MDRQAAERPNKQMDKPTTGRPIVCTDRKTADGPAQPLDQSTSGQSAIRTTRQAAGRKAEDIAADFLSDQGLKLLLRNYRRRRGEIDVVAQEREVLVIAEVRTRASDEYGGAAASVTRGKQARIRRAAMQLLQQNKDFARMPVRFDVLVVSELDSDAPKVEWIKHAFMSSR